MRGTRIEEGDAKPGDLIVAIDGHPVTRGRDLLVLLDGHKVGDEVVVTVERQEGEEVKKVDLKVTLAAAQ
jgi:S1-C subfamily serine protease